MPLGRCGCPMSPRSVRSSPSPAAGSPGRASPTRRGPALRALRGPQRAPRLSRAYPPPSPRASGSGGDVAGVPIGRRRRGQLAHPPSRAAQSAPREDPEAGLGEGEGDGEGHGVLGGDAVGRREGERGAHLVDPDAPGVIGRASARVTPARTAPAPARPTQPRPSAFGTAAIASQAKTHWPRAARPTRASAPGRPRPGASGGLPPSSAPPPGARAATSRARSRPCSPPRAAAAARRPARRAR